MDTDSQSLTSLSPTALGLLCAAGAAWLFVVYYICSGVARSVSALVASGRAPYEVEETKSSSRKSSKKPPPKGKSKGQSTKHDAKDEEDEVVPEPAPSSSASLKSLNKRIENAKRAKRPADAAAPDKTHPLCLNTLKGHQDNITDLSFSPDGTHLATSCEDQAVRIFKLDGSSAKQSARVNLEREHGVGVTFGSTPESFVVAAAGSAGATNLIGYKMAQGSGKPEAKWRQSAAAAHGKSDVTSLVSATSPSGGNLALSCCADGDLHFGVWLSDSGRLLEAVSTNQMKNHMVSISADCRFCAVAAFTADVKVWELKWDKQGGGFQKAEKVMNLKGHKSGVTAVCFDASSKRVVTASKDGTWILWNIDVRYHLNEDPRILLRGELQRGVKAYTRLAMSTAGVLAAVGGGELHFIDTARGGRLMDAVQAPHATQITSMEWSPTAALLATAAADDTKLKLWNPPTP